MIITHTAHGQPLCIAQSASTEPYQAQPAGTHETVSRTLHIQAAKVVAAHAASIGDALLGVPLLCSAGARAPAGPCGGCSRVGPLQRLHVTAPPASCRRQAYPPWTPALSFAPAVPLLKGGRFSLKRKQLTVGPTLVVRCMPQGS